ncbi:MAG: 3,4-dihydroxy-2-butanone-4-phosphate synthase [Lentisphaeraceae bacterium]|nr:3,4-dihydroxy-2-butanone-4-phosphate synthase [Lentisphaeraceae bacterium]
MLDNVKDAIEDIKSGKMVIVIDDEDRENEGDLVFAAEKVSPELINFMATHGRGLICCAITPERASSLKLRLMAQENTCPFQTAFTVSVDAKDVTTTGISASDRFHTVQRLADENFTADDFVRPGHMFPLIANSGGVLARRGQTEASVDLAKLAGLYPAGVICEIMNDDGSMARLPDLKKYAKKHDLKIISIEDMVQYIEKL